MEVIALTGRKDSGKSDTLNVLYHLLLASGWTQVPGHFKDLTHWDFYDVLTDGERLLGIVTQGDYATRVPDYLSILAAAGCVMTVCACTTGKPRLSAAIARYAPHSFIRKTVGVTPESLRIANNTDAQHLITLI